MALRSSSPQEKHSQPFTVFQVDVPCFPAIGSGVRCEQPDAELSTPISSVGAFVITSDISICSLKSLRPQKSLG
jgi:hypothetical protein